MSKTRSLAIVGLCLVNCLAGCGPTATGLENRKAAKERVGLFHAQLSFDQAKQSFEVGRLDRAEAAIKTAIMQYPDAPEFWVMQGRILLEKHRLETALESFMTAVEKDPEMAEAHYYAGIVFERWSDDEQAYEQHLAASELDPTNVQYLLAAAESLVALGEIQAARALVEPRLDYFEHNAAMHHLLGQLYLLEGQQALAADQYAEAQLLNPNDLSLLEETARVLFDADRYEDCHNAVSQWRQNTGEERSDMLLMEARCLAMMDRSEDARDVYQQLTQSDPSNVIVWIELGTTAWEMQDFHRVAQCSVRTIALAPDRFEGYMLRGVNERQRGHLQEAVSAFREAAKRASNSAMPAILLGLTLEQQGMAGPALEAYAEAMRIEPENPEAAMLHDRLLQTQTASVPADN